MTHSELVERAARWLRGTRRCSVVATERRCWKAMESPDAIGWLPDGHSVLVECKTSRADFLADLRKPHRIVSGMGSERWFLAPEGIFATEELPAGWGFITVRDGKIRRMAQAAVSPATPALSELQLLVAITRRALGGFRDGVTQPGGADSDTEAA